MAQQKPEREGDTTDGRAGPTPADHCRELLVFKLRLHLIHPFNEHIFIAAKGGMVDSNL